MKRAIQKTTRTASLSIVLVLILQSCYWQDIHIKEYLRPIRKIFNKDRNYWTDKIEYRGESGSEIVYYKNGRPALERLFDEGGLLQTVTYFDRQGEAIRSDSLVYAEEELIGGYYHAEPDHQLVLRFVNYQRQGQLSQRSWFDGSHGLLSREFFLFDLQGKRRMRLIFDGNDSLLFTETFMGHRDELELQNTYNLQGQLIFQTRYQESRDPVRYQFDGRGQIQKVFQLRKDASIAWVNDLIYGANGTIIQSNFSTESRFLVSHMGSLEFFQQTARTWKHPGQPGQRLDLIKYGHKDPWVEEKGHPNDSTWTREYRFPHSKALFKKSVINAQNITRSDTLFGTGPGLTPVAIIDYDEQGNISQELSFDQQGDPRWLRNWFRDADKRVIREEVTALPDSFSAAITRFYDCLGESAFSERFSDHGVFEGTWVNYHGGGIKKTLYYNTETKLTESWLFRPAGDTVIHSRYQDIDYFTVESRYGPLDSLRSQKRFTLDGLLNWELTFNEKGQVVRETHHKKSGELYREVLYDPEARTIESTTFAPGDPYSVKIDPDVRGEVSSHVVSKLNAQGQIVQLVSRNTSGDVEWEKRYAYRSGKLLKSAQLDAQGKPVVVSTYTHNEQSQVLTETALNPEGEQVHVVEQRYNENGQLIWKSFNSPMSGIKSSNRYYYNENGLPHRNEIIESMHFVEAVDYEYYPEYYLRIASHFDPEGTLLRKEIENYYGKNVFALGKPDMD